jgi:hypothetical protein
MRLALASLIAFVEIGTQQLLCFALPFLALNFIY